MEAIQLEKKRKNLYVTGSNMEIISELAYEKSKLAVQLEESEQLMDKYKNFIVNLYYCGRITEEEIENIQRERY